MKLLSILFLSFAFLNTKTQNISYSVVIKNVSVISIPGGSLQKTNFYIDEKGAGIASTKNFKAKKIIDGTSKFLMPGLTDMHVHFPTADKDRFFNLLTAAGITNCRIMKSDSTTIDYRKTHNPPEFPGMYVAYNIYNSDSLSSEIIQSKITNAQKEGYDFIKIFGLKDGNYFNEIMATAKKFDLPVCGHALANIEAMKAINSGYRSIEHVGYFDKAKPGNLDALLDSAAKYHLFICPTLDWTIMVRHSVPEDSLAFRQGYAMGKKLYGKQWDSTYSAVTKEMGDKADFYAKYLRKDVAKKIEILKKMRAKSITLIAGSDAEEPYQTPGYSLIEELKLIAKAGYSNAGLLQMVTTNAKDFFAGESEYDSGFILLSKNPLQDVNNLATVEYVIKKNEVVDCKKLLTEAQ